VSSESWYLVVVGLVVLERFAELVVSQRNVAWAKARGGVEHGHGHYLPMVLLHTGFLIACVAEVLIADRPFIPALGVPMLVVLVAAQLLRWWCIGTLGRRWSTRVVVLPGEPLVAHGPYRWLSHPNYVAVVAEGLALPLLHTAWVTALAFTLLNAVLLLGFRLPVERRALDAARP
jgi:methyltransferase